MQINELASFILFCQELCKFWLADDAIELLLPPVALFASSFALHASVSRCSEWTNGPTPSHM